MNLSLDVPRHLSNNHSIVFNSQSQALERASAGHSTARFFGTKSAQAVNRQTLGNETPPEGAFASGPSPLDATFMQV